MKMPQVVKVYKDGRRESFGEVEVSEEQQEVMAKMLAEIVFSEQEAKSIEKKGA